MTRLKRMQFVPVQQFPFRDDSNETVVSMEAERSTSKLIAEQAGHCEWSRLITEIRKNSRKNRFMGARLFVLIAGFSRVLNR